MKSSRCFLTLAVLVVAFAVFALAQQPAPAAAPSIPTTGFAGLDQYRARRIAVFTDVWHLDEYFPGKSYVNRGIGGQTTPQMLVRFRQDVINLQPKVVIILAGTNDIAGNTGPMRNEDIEANLASMAELARAHDIHVVLCSIMPVHNYTDRAKDFFAQRPQSRILALNEWIKDYSAKNNLVYVDYFSALVDDKGMMKKELADDGLHPNAAGYKIAAPLAEAGIEK